MSINILTSKELIQESNYLNKTPYSKDGLEIIPRSLFRLQVILDGVEWTALDIVHVVLYYLPCELASGNIGVAGIGLGYPLVKILSKPEVIKADVYEIDDRFIEYFKASYGNEDWFNKITFINQDVRLMSGKTYDFFHVDIYNAKDTQLRTDDLSLLKTNNNINRLYIQSEEIVYILFEEQFTLNQIENEFVSYIKDNIDKHFLLMDYYNKIDAQNWDVFVTELKVWK